MTFFVAILSRDTIKNECAFTLMQLCHTLGKMGHEVFPFIIDSCFVDEGRNVCFEKAKEKNVDYLFFIDSDIYISSDLRETIDKMINLNKDVVAALYFGRNVPHRPSALQITENIGIYKSILEIPEKPFQIEITGCGFTLIKRKILNAFTGEIIQKIGKPFSFIEKHNMADDPHREDISFCLRLKKLGFEIWIDPTIETGHVFKTGINKLHWDAAAKNKEKI